MMRPADLLKPEWDELRDRSLALKGCNGTDEDVLTYAMFPQVAPKFFSERASGAKESWRKEPNAPLARRSGSDTFWQWQRVRPLRGTHQV